MTKKRVDELREGDRLDLEGDRFADPDSTDPYYESEYAVVDNIERETGSCIRVDFQAGQSVGFPPDHLVEVDD